MTKLIYSLTAVVALSACNSRTNQPLVYSNAYAIDSVYQSILAEELNPHVEQCQADWGCAILMNAHTRDVLAVYSTDSVEHHTVAMEMGTIITPLSLLVCMTDTGYHAQKIQVTRQPYNPAIDGCEWSQALIYEIYPRDTAYDVREMIAVSSNIGISRMIVRQYLDRPEAFRHQMEQYGFIITSNDSLPWADNLSIGRGYAIEPTPLQIADLYSRIATGRDIPASKEQLDILRSALHDVVWKDGFGTASRNFLGMPRAQSDKVAIAGKTGSVQLRVDGRYSNRHQCLSFVGYFPEEDPEYTCLVIIYHPRNRGIYDAGTDCGSTVRSIAERVMDSKKNIINQSPKSVCHTHY